MWWTDWSQAVSGRGMMRLGEGEGEGERRGRGREGVLKRSRTLGMAARV